ncbi:MAG: NUDIX hydrolase [Pseudomonadales bacterium]|jgi:8-oxo-dGTP pyrophosphatase MutT (NUDIX family)|tara:strand:- start:763 stop:1269 length:507 start_codon:yes stop_codon:yes gene_type:complete
MKTLPTRNVARAILINDKHQCFLFKLKLPWISGAVWMAAGGGMEAGESPQKALIRELYEETGLTNVDVGNLLWECRFSFQYNNEIRPIYERYYLVKTQDFEPSFEGMAQYEIDSLVEFRWWSLTELQTTTDYFSPKQLPTLLSQILEATFSDRDLIITDPLPTNYAPC